MKNFFQRMRTKKWAVGITLLLFAVFFVRDGYEKKSVSHAADYEIIDSAGNAVTENYVLRRAMETFYVSGSADMDTFSWECLNPEILEINTATANSPIVSVTAKSFGSAAMLVRITHLDSETGENVTQDIYFSIEVRLSINEDLGSGAAPVKITRVNPEDERLSIVMNYSQDNIGNFLPFGASGKDNRNDSLTLVFGDATSTNATWSSSNEDVVSVQAGGIAAVGAGRALLTVTYRDGLDTYEDSIWVYVRPELHRDDSSGELLGASEDQVTMENGDRIWVSARYVAQPLEGILNKVTWVIAKRSGTQRTLVRDSLGNVGENPEDANLIFDSSAGNFRLDAKAGQYVIQFFVIGTYTDFETAQDPARVLGCEPVSISVNVSSRFRHEEVKEVTIDIGGYYSLAEAFNISLSSLRSSEYFIVEEMQNDGEWIKFDPDTMTVEGLKEGVATFKVRCLSSPAIPDVYSGNTVTVRINVTDTFRLNVSSATLAVGASLDLIGIIGSGQYTEASSFRWETSENAETYISLNSNGQYATVKAVRTTPANSPVTVTLYWTNNEGVTRKASCTIYVTTSATQLNLYPDEVQMEVDQTVTVSTRLTGQQNLLWLSSDTDIVTVDPVQGNVDAFLKAGKKPGTAIVTVLNPANNAYATCRVTVSSPITDLSIEQGEYIDTVLAAGFVFLKAKYQPADATATDLIWSVDDPTKASVDENGVVTLLQEGTVRVDVRPAYNPNQVYAHCYINVRYNPVTDVEVDETELYLIKGEVYTVGARAIPNDATNPSLTWTSLSPSVATVDGGNIIAVAPGDANIMVQSVDGPAKVITVHVRDRLKKISFTQTEFEIKKGDTFSLRNAVIFDPAENVNTNLSWASSNNSVVSVDANGNITGLKAGQTAVITCVAEDLGLLGAITCWVRVIDEDVPATGVTLKQTEATMYVGDFLQMEPIFTPVTATYQNLSWSSTDPSIATVDENGMVTALAEGTATITGVYRNPIDNTVWDPVYCKITVLKALVPVEGLALSPDNMEIYTGQSLAVVPVFTPADATDQGVTYQSSDDSIANVDEQGMVTGIASGSAVIICRSNEGGYVATCNVKVIQGVFLSLSPTYREIALGKTFTIKKTILPEEYADSPVTWESSNEKIATVSKNGKVKGVKKGNCVITCTIPKYNAKAVCEVKVASLRTTIKLNKTNIRIGKGQTYKLKATVWTNNSKKPSVKWTTSNRRIATVGQKGKVKAKKLGYATIMATTTDKLKVRAKCKVRVILRAKSVQIVPNYAVCYIGGTKTLKAVVKPANATLKTVSWKSSDTSIATVTGGKVRGLAEGTVTITATAKDGSGKKGTCILKVMEEIPASSIVVAQSELTMKKGDSAKLSYTVLPNNTSDDITFASDNKRVAKVGADGTVKAVGTGECTITIMSSGGQTSTVSVNVVALNRTSLTMRQYDTETLTVNGTNATVTWYSGNARVATVEDGKVTGRSKGSTYIYAYVKGCKLSCRVTITNIK